MRSTIGSSPILAGVSLSGNAIKSHLTTFSLFSLHPLCFLLRYLAWTLYGLVTTCRFFFMYFLYVFTLLFNLWIFSVSHDGDILYVI
ncbi:hypothetical protein BJ165DRAFT_1507381 [Panaeolus papilionaceus]|nr:hypothetical protein BJ165DRAFT_1507381 [Panaeolus papilionaceus]